MIAASIAVEEALLLLKIGFLVLLYLFLWRIVRTASRDLRTPQESFVLAPAAGAERHGTVGAAGRRAGSCSSPTAMARGTRTRSTRPPSRSAVATRTTSRSTTSSRRRSTPGVESRRDGVWLEDVGSTNGTAVNGVLIEQPRKLSPGDVIRIGETDLRFER